MIFEFLTVLLLKTHVLIVTCHWVVGQVLSSVSKGHNAVLSGWSCLTLKMRPPQSFETSGTTCQGDFIATCFTVTGKHTVYRMSAATPEEKDEWIKCVRWVKLQLLMYLQTLRLLVATAEGITSSLKVCRLQGPGFWPVMIASFSAIVLTFCNFVKSGSGHMAVEWASPTLQLFGTSLWAQSNAVFYKVRFIAFNVQVLF